jgi:radical SAM superfamily enzyme YgiQ (UPF0313 family)
LNAVNVLLVSPPILDVVAGRLRPVGVDAERECPPVGIYNLAAALEEVGHTVTVADLVLAGGRSMESFAAAVDTADIVGIGATSMAWPAALDVLAQVRARRPEVPVVCGGIHPTLFDRYVLETYPVNFVIRGDGEDALIALCAALGGERELADVPNLSLLHEGHLRRTPVAAARDRRALEDLPLPAYGRLPARSYKCLGLESSRGCSFDCSFCSTPYRRSYRALSADAFVQRLRAVMEDLDRTTSGCVHIVDDEFALEPERARAIADRLSKTGQAAHLLYDARARDLLHDGLVAALAPFTTCLLVGAECGYDEGLKKIGKGSTCATLEAAARELAHHGIAARTDFSFILGLPWETKREVERTVEFATHLYASYGVHVMLQWYQQIPGSRLWQEARDAGEIHEAMYDRYGFFRDVYLFRSGCRLQPREIWEIAEMTDQLRFLAELRGPGRPSIVHHFPTPIAQNFPRQALDGSDTGLVNLRELARSVPRGDKETVHEQRT